MNDDFRTETCACGHQMVGIRVNPPAGNPPTNRHEFYCHDCGRTWLAGDGKGEDLHERFKNGPTCECGHRLYYHSTQLRPGKGIEGAYWVCRKCGVAYWQPSAKLDEPPAPVERVDEAKNRRLLLTFRPNGTL